jgi:hypothetical protein
MVSNEIEAEAELRKLLTQLTGAGVTSELSDRIRESAGEMFHTFPNSAEVARLFERIIGVVDSPNTREPESCRQLKQKLKPPFTVKNIVSAINESGFRGRRDLSDLEDDCFSNIIHGPLQALRVSFESTEEVSSRENLQIRVTSLQDVLNALPPDVLKPRQELKNLIHDLELSASREEFNHLLLNLRQHANAQASMPATEHDGLLTNVWARENPNALQVEEAQRHAARLEELERAFSTQLADVDRIRHLIEKRDYDQGLNEVNLSEKRLRDTGLLNRAPLDEVISQLMARLAEIYEWEKQAFTDSAVSIKELKESIAKIQNLMATLQKAPESKRQAAEDLQEKCSVLINERAQQLDRLSLSNARVKLQQIKTSEIPDYVQTLRSSDQLVLREWAQRVQSIWNALNHVRNDAAAVDPSYLELLDSAENILGHCPFAEAAQQAGRDYGLNVAKEVLRSRELLVQTIEKATLDLAAIRSPVQLREALDSVMKYVGEYRKMQETPFAKSVSAALQLFSSEALAHDQRVRLIRQTTIPQAANRWTEMIVAEARNQEDLDRASELLTGWRDSLGNDFPYAGALRRLAERGAELQIQALEAEGDFDQALQLLKQKQNLLSDHVFLQLERQLRRRQAAASYQIGGENEIANAVRAFGPDNELLQILIDDFLRNGNCKLLSSIYERISQIKNENGQSATLVQWCFDFQSERLDELARQLATAESLDSLALFAKALAAGDRHAAGLRVLNLAIKSPLGSDAKAETMIASYQILSDKFAAACRRIETEFSALQERCDQLPNRFEPLTDAELRKQLDEAFARAGVFLSEALVEVSGWRDYLTLAERFEAEFEMSLLRRIQDLDQNLLANGVLLQKLDRARSVAALQGWVKLDDLHKLVNAPLRRLVAPMATVNRLLLEYFDNYGAIVKFTGVLVTAESKGGDGLSHPELKQIVRRLEELRYDFRPEQDRFYQVARFGGKKFSQFISDLENMVSEIENVANYGKQLKDLLVGKEEPLRLRMRGDSDARKEEVGRLLRMPGPEGKSLLDVYETPPVVSKSPIAVERLRDLRVTDWYELLKRAVDLIEER